MKCNTRKFSVAAATLAMAALILVVAAGVFGGFKTSPPVLAASTSAGASASSAVSSRAYLHSYNLASKGIAIEGYCPVAYFTEQRAREGSPSFAADFNGVTYFLSSAEAKQAFEADPQAYIPAYGGWCAYGMAVEDKFPVDPTNFKIVDGRLMLFLRNVNVDALALWNRGDQSEYTQRADAHWRKVSQ